MSKTKLTFLGLLIETLLITNVWIFLYNNILFYLRLKIPSPSIANFIVVWPKPEPSEIPLYLILTLITVFLVFLLHAFVLKKSGTPTKQRKLAKIITVTKYLFLAALFLIFFSNLGSYPLKGDIFPYENKDPAIETYFYLFIYLGSISVIVVESFILSHLFSLKKKTFMLGISAFIIILIAFFTFEPGFPISPHDYSFFFGPIYEVVHGKTLYTEATSQYGFFSILFFALLHKIGLLPFGYLPAFIWILYIVEYFLCFVIIYRISRSLLLSLLALFSIMTVNYFSLYHLPISIPQVGALRWFPLVFLIAAFSFLKRVDSKLFIHLTAVSSFWIIDSGLAIILGFFLTLGIFFLGKVIDIKIALRAGILFILNLVIIFITLNGVHLLLGLRAIDFLSIFLRLRQYTQAGFGMLPMESRTYFWLIVCVYLLSIVHFFRKEKRHYNDLVLIFIANLSLISATYYVGRTHPHNLFNLAVFLLLNIFTFLSLYVKEITSSKAKLIAYTAIFIVFIFFPAFNRKETMAKIIKKKVEKLKQGNVFTSVFDRALQTRFSEEIKIINEHLIDDEIAILSIDDTFLLYLTQKKNLLYNNPQIAATTYDDLNFTLQKALKVCPQKIAIDCRAIKKCPNYAPLNESSIFMPPLLLNIMQERCSTKYEPIVCTKQLCIVVSTKKK